MHELFNFCQTDKQRAIVNAVLSHGSNRKAVDCIHRGAKDRPAEENPPKRVMCCWSGRFVRSVLVVQFVKQNLTVKYYSAKDGYCKVIRSM